MRALGLSLWIALVSCGSVSPHDMPAPPDVPPDMPSDLGSDAMPAPSPGRELAAAAGRLGGGAWTVDVQLGSMTPQSPASGETWTARGGAPVNP